MKILMVCLGNICRSPLAEGIMKQQVKEAGLDWEVDSAGTGNWHVGEGPDRRSTRTARNHGINISKQVCRQFKVQDFDNFDLILVMDRNNRADVLALARNQHDRDKVKLLLNDKEVPDPYFDDRQFEPVFDLIESGCKDLIRKYK
ncbi:low molecular weight protein-tyrosine-phosphatase [Mucilaginibacter arboris]|uniref:protein-tyrosine-phosphatase n=1 Tax=Mucilaginibacter arboris TaxID=2682090 RepID=A0A7K1SS54_9SPHI|nr:low molecular weight protein-tyrosine-phosphatase [Mucilaginibacter arboris]MVN20151.1 low molecular weight phosphotyrosine protein phosphatase [Mucilaginibacter arboris]